MQYRHLTALTILLSMGLFTACGGGGGSSNPPPPPAVTLTAANSQIAADAAMDAINSSDTSSSFGLFPVVGSSSGGKYGLMELTSDVLNGTLNQNGVAPTQGVVQTGFCDNEPSGYADVTQTGTNSGSVYFSNCLLVDVYLNGGASVNISTDNGTSTAGTMTFSNLSASDATGVLFTINGSVNFTETSTSMTISGNYLSVSLGTETVAMHNFNIYNSTSGSVDSTIIYSLTISSNIMGGSISVTTESPILQNVGDLYPYAGVLVLVGANNTKVRVSAMGDGSPTGIVRIEYDLDGTPGYETFEDLTWAELDAVGGN